MRRQYRSFLFALLVPAFFLVSAFAVLMAAEEQGSQAVKQELWSNPATWPDRKVPGAGDTVTIEKARMCSSTSVRRRWAPCKSKAN